MKLGNSSHALMIRKSQEGIWGGRQRALAVLYGKNGTNPRPQKANKNCGETKGGLLRQYYFISPCAQYIVF